MSDVRCAPLAACNFSLRGRNDFLINRCAHIIEQNSAENTSKLANGNTVGNRSLYVYSRRTVIKHMRLCLMFLWWSDWVDPQREELSRLLVRRNCSLCCDWVRFIYCPNRVLHQIGLHCESFIAVGDQYSKCCLQELLEMSIWKIDRFPSTIHAECCATIKYMYMLICLHACKQLNGDERWLDAAYKKKPTWRHSEHNCWSVQDNI